MQTESCLRLINDNEIVGYEIKVINEMGFIDIHHIKSITDYLDDTNVVINLNNDPIVYDSFEFGIKVGDEWWFEGDIIKIICAPYYGETDIIKVTYYNTPFFNGKCYLPMTSFLPQSMERVGNIHENMPQDARKSQNNQNYSETEKVQPD